MGAPRKADWREERRKRDCKLKEQGWQQKDIATALGVSEGTVSQCPSAPRSDPRLSMEQKAQIPNLLAKGAKAYGFRGDVWTASRVADPSSARD